MQRALTRTGRLLITSLGLGALRPAPGTWGSVPPVAAAAVLIAIGLGPRDSSPAIALYTVVMLGIAAVSALVCIRYGEMAEAHFGKKDPGSVTADETAGMALVLIHLPATGAKPAHALAALGAAFVTFRVFDIVKAWPADRLQRVPGGWGILLDDLVAGVQAWVVLQVLWWLVIGAV